MSGEGCSLSHGRGIRGSTALEWKGGRSRPPREYNESVRGLWRCIPRRGVRGSAALEITPVLDRLAMADAFCFPSFRIPACTEQPSFYFAMCFC